MDIKSTRLKGRKIALCITGSIASVESVKLARELRRHSAEVVAYLTPSALEFIGEKAIEFATANKPVVEITGKLEHLQEFDLIIVAPASANTIAKLAHGIADNPVTLLVLSSKAPVLLAPAMHASMAEKPVMIENLKKLEDSGFHIIAPKIEESAHKLPEISEICDYAIRLCSGMPLRSRKVVVTAGATLEPIDDVRVITNRSSGAMGVALAREAFYLGADVVLIHGMLRVEVPRYIKKIKAESIEDMKKAVEKEEADIFISAAAVGDFKVKNKFDGKLDSRSGDVQITLTPAPKIIKHAKAKFKVGFKALPGEGELVSRAKSLLEEHALDLVIANDVRAMGSQENEVFIVDGKAVKKIERAPKAEIARRIFQEILKRFHG